MFSLAVVMFERVQSDQEPMNRGASAVQWLTIFQVPNRRFLLYAHDPSESL